MTNPARLLAVPLAAVAVASAVACGSYAPSYPHAWCAPLITAFHAHQSRQAYLNGLVAAGKQGAPVAQLVGDETAYTQDEADAAGTGTDSFAALADAPKVLARVTADLKALNALCGQPASAYKGDDA